MDTKTSRSVYAQYQDLSFLDESNEPKPSGLLTPTRVSNRNSMANFNEPGVRIAKYVSSIRKLNPKKNKVT
tara:strand:- start:143 stop:355 length:213 start_codon:yes stop_codon:yes gene_type:complete